MRSLDGAQTDAIISDQKRRSFCRHAVSVARRNQPERRHPGLVRIKRPKISPDSEEESEQIHRFQWSLAPCGEVDFRQDATGAFWLQPDSQPSDASSQV